MATNKPYLSPKGKSGYVLAQKQKSNTLLTPKNTLKIPVGGLNPNTLAKANRNTKGNNKFA